MIALTPLFDLHAQVDDVIDFQPGPAGHLRVVRILGGRFEGARLSGTLLEAGADWQTIRGDGVAELDVRCLMRTDQGELIHLRGQGLRHGPPEVMARLARGEAVDPGAYYFREVMRFQTSAPRLLWLNNVFGLASGRREARAVVLEVFEVG
jgi:hypothetical protein